MGIMERILDEMDASRERRYERKTHPQIAQYNGFREEWNDYAELFIDEGNSDWR